MMTPSRSSRPATRRDLSFLPQAPRDIHREPAPAHVCSERLRVHESSAQTASVPRYRSGRVSKMTLWQPVLSVSCQRAGSNW